MVEIRLFLFGNPNTMRRVGCLLSILLMLAGCTAYQIVSTDPSMSHGLVINGAASIPLPDHFTELSTSESVVIVIGESTMIAYRWIDQGEIEFIGSQETPYRFFSEAFSNPSEEVQNVFMEAIDTTNTNTHISHNGLEFYHFPQAHTEKLYIISESLEFAIEISLYQASKKYLQTVLERTHIKQGQ